MRSWRKNKFSNTHHCCRHFKPGTTGIFHLHNCSGSRPMLPVGKKQQQQQRGTADVRDMSVFLLFLRVCVWWIDPHLRYLPLCYTLYIDSIHLKVICVIVFSCCLCLPPCLQVCGLLSQFFFVLSQKFLNVNVQRLQVFESTLLWTFENRAMVFMSVLCSKSPTLLSGQPQHMLSLSNDSFF